MPVCEQLAQLKAESGLPLRALAASTGVSKSSLADVFLGRSLPSATVLRLLCEAFEVPLPRAARLQEDLVAERIAMVDRRFGLRKGGVGAVEVRQAARRAQAVLGVVYRVCRHEPRNVYRCDGMTRDDDSYIGVFFTEADAALVVEALNNSARPVSCPTPSER